VFGSGASTPDHQGPNLPGYFLYLSLVFRWITTLIILIMAGWVVFTIKTTRKLHKPHNIFVANLMIADITSVMLISVQTSIMMIGYATGLGDFISCRVYRFLLLPVFVLYCTYLMIAVNQAIAIAFPFKYRKIMKRHIVIGSIAAAWLVAILLYSHVFFEASYSYTKVAQYGTCLSSNRTIVFALLTFMLPNVASSLSVLAINIYLCLKAYQVQKQMREESRLSGTTSNEVNNLKKKQATIKTHLKPMITLLVVVLGSSGIVLLFPLLYFPVKILTTSTVYEDMMKYVITPNFGYLVIFFNPFVYGLYYKQVREPMIKVLKTITCRNKFNSVAPQARRTGWM